MRSSYRPPISEKSLKALQQRMGDAAPMNWQDRAVESYTSYGFAVVAALWLLLMVCAPFVLLLVPFGINWTIEWLYAAASLLVGTLLFSVSLSPLTLLQEWLTEHKTATLAKFLFWSVAIVLSIGLAVWYWFDATDYPPTLADQVRIMTIGVWFSVLLVGVHINRLISSSEIALVYRLLNLVGAFCISWSLMLIVLSQVFEPYRLEAWWASADLRAIVQIGGLVLLNWGRWKSTSSVPPQPWSRTSRIVFNSCIIVIIIILLVAIFG